MPFAADPEFSVATEVERVWQPKDSWTKDLYRERTVSRRRTCLFDG